MKSLVSVIIPAYNAENYILTAVGSLVNQTYDNLEIIIINDGSTDNTLSLINSCLDPRIKCITIENSGVSAARNVGLENSTGDYFCFLDADDVYVENAIEVMLNAIKAADADLCYAKSVNVIPNKMEAIPITENKIIDIFDGTDFLKKCLKDEMIGWSVWGKLYRKKKFEEIRFVNGKKVNEDSFYVFQCAMQCPIVVCIDSFLYKYYAWENSASRTAFSEKFLDILYFAKEKTNLIEKYFPELMNMCEYVNFNANLSMLRNFCKTYDKKWNNIEKNVFLM